MSGDGARSVESLRADFPALERREQGRAVAYFDGPGGTQVPRAVVDAITDYLARTEQLVLQVSDLLTLRYFTHVYEPAHATLI